MKYQHDCDKCTPLGEYEEYDLYHCEQGGLPTVVARYGDDGPDYISGAAFIGVNPALREAGRRSVALNLSLGAEE